MTPNTSDQKYKTIKMFLSLRGTTLENVPEAKNAESEVKSAPELKTFTIHPFSFLFLFLLIFGNFSANFMQLDEILMRRERNHDLILALGSIRQILCDLAF